MLQTTVHMYLHVESGRADGALKAVMKCREIGMHAKASSMSRGGGEHEIKPRIYHYMRLR